jgi:hypothetical protein
MADVTRVTITFQDRYKQTSRLVFHFPGVLPSPADAIVTGLITVLEAVMIARAIRIEMSVVQAIAATAVAGDYGSSSDKALLQLMDEEGTAHTWKIPGIKAALVSAVDHKTIANAGAMGVLVTELLDSGVGAGGADLVSFKTAYRTMARKVNKR